jgi:tRNA:m4X modification enzyme
VIVDRDTRRRKLDKNFRDEFFTIREKMDIADFDVQTYLLSQKEVIKDESELLCVAKHLCGGATDLSLTSILKKQDKWPVTGVAIATCCHHQCDLKTYCNLDFLRNEGFSEE